jgi:GT2 family glycosyltransferase/SAM-dependent methyltransferase
MGPLNVKDQTEESALQEPEPAPQEVFDVRTDLARHFIRGSGLEIGALQAPLNVPPEAGVTYVDRLTVERLRVEYPELDELELTPVDIVDDGEQLESVSDATQDFIIASHFLEHCEDPIGTIETHLRKLKPGGILLYVVPDKRYTFDFRRPVTPLEHMVSDHESGPEHSRSHHYDEWTRLVGDIPEPQADGQARELEASRYSIHFHVWTQAEFMELLLYCRQRFGKAFEIEALARRSIEVVVVLRKAGPFDQSGPAGANSGARTTSQATAPVGDRANGPARHERPRPTSDVLRADSAPVSEIAQDPPATTSRIPLASLRHTVLGAWSDGPVWVPDGQAGAVRSLTQPCGTAVVFPLALTPGARLRARVSLSVSGPVRALAVRARVSVGEAGGTENVIFSRIIGLAGGRSVPPSIPVDLPLGGAGNADLILRVTPLTPSAGAKGLLMWRDAVVDLMAPVPALHRRRQDARPTPSPRDASRGPLISLLTPVHDPTPEMLAEALDSVRRQTLGSWELCLVDDASRDPRVIEMIDRSVAQDPRIRLIRRDRSGGISEATNDALSLASGDYVACFDHDDVLVDDALATIAAAIEERPEADLLYTDEDLVLGGQRYALALKPGWSPDLLRSTMYVCHLTVTRRSLALELGGFRPEFDGSQDYDFVLRASERAGRIVHIPRVLYHWRVHRGSAAGSDTAKPYAYTAARRAIEEHLRRTGVDGDVHFGVIPGVYRVVHPVPPGVRAAVILAVSAEDQRMADEVAAAAYSWAACTCRPYELVLVGSADVISVCARGLPPGGSAGRLVGVEAPPAAGVATLMNLGASAAESDYLLLLDGPVESLTRDWLARLVGFASQPEVGAAGGKTLTADGRVENVGVLLSDGLPLPLLHGAHAGDEGPLGIARVPCNLSAVSGAVAIRNETFTTLGGLVEDVGPLGVVDFCLRAREDGMRIVSAPDAVVRRTGTAVPVNDLPALHAFRMRWRDRLGRDPYFNPGYYGDRGDLAARPDI